MGAKVKNPRKRFLWQISFPKHPVNSYKFQSCTLPEVSIEEVSHGDINRDVKTGGRVTIGTMTVRKLLTTDGSDTWFWDWLNSVQDILLGGGLVPTEYWEDAVVQELAEDGVTVINTHLLSEVWPTRVNGLELDRTSSENTIEEIEFSVGTYDKI